MSPSTAPPSHHRGPADHGVRSQIVVAAREHFSRYGYGKTTVSDLAKSIGFSKAYIYKFFESKQVIGEMICANCLADIEAEIRKVVAEAATPPDQLRGMFTAVVEATLRLLDQDSKLYEIAASAATERWQATVVYESRLRSLLLGILEAGRQSGDFERKTPLDETASAIFLVVRPYTHPVMLQHSLEQVKRAPVELANLVLRSLSP